MTALTDYERKQPDYKAAVWSGAGDVTEGVSDNENGSFSVMTENGPQTIEPGDVVVKDGEGNYEVSTSTRFNQIFKTRVRR